MALVDVDLTDATGTSSAFTNCTFVNCNLFGAPFTGCTLVGSMFDRCRFDLLTVSEGDWSFVGLPGADLHGSDLSSQDPGSTTIAGATIDVQQALVVATALGFVLQPLD